MLQIIATCDICGKQIVCEHRTNFERSRNWLRDKGWSCSSYVGAPDPVYVCRCPECRSKHRDKLNLSK